VTTYGDEDALESVMFPVREAGVLVEIEPDRLAPVLKSKALVNERSGDVISIVGAGYQVLHNRTALELGVRGCVATFPETSPAAWRVTMVDGPRTGAYCVLDLRYRSEAEPLVYDWGFPRSHIERYEPFFQVVNGYNGRIAFSLRFGVMRLVCENGLIGVESINHTSVAHDHRDMAALVETAIREADFTGQADRIKAQLGRLWQVEIPFKYFTPAIHAVLGIRRPIRMDDRGHHTWKELQGTIEEKRDRYLGELGFTAYALMAALTDLATSPPVGRPFIYRERHNLQRLAGLWMRDFARSAGEPGFDLAEYFRQLSGNRGLRGPGDFLRSAPSASSSPLP